MYDGAGTTKGAFFKSMQDDDMWTCTPGSEVVLPARDELYNRNTDRFQLSNIIDENPEIAKEMLQQLKTYMAELRTR